MTMTIMTMAIMMAPAAIVHADDVDDKYDDMVYIASGTYHMGFDKGHDDELPLHKVKLESFYLDRHEVTNRQFAMFVQATGYVTRAEKDGYCWSYLDGAANFEQVPGAYWRHPEGSGSSIEKRLDHPVVCVNWYDASAYAVWAGKRLPTEAEWEYAARAGEDDHFVALNDSHTSHGKDMAHQSNIRMALAGSRDHLLTQDQSPSSKSHGAGSKGHGSHRSNAGETIVTANIWQGGWPEVNRRIDGYFYTAPVKSYQSNDWGIYDMIGNVWEWTADWYSEDYYNHSPANNPSGPDSGEKRVARGGSWFCNPDYCGAYNTHYRGASPPDRGFNNVGFRCAADAPDEIGAVDKENK